MNDAIDPPDAFTPDCSWCGTDLRPTAFCCASCESDSRRANAEPASDDEPYTDPLHDLVWLAARGL